MKAIYTLTPELRVKLKEPFGILIQGSFQETMTKMKELVAREKPPRVVAVGDIVSHNLHKYNINPQLAIIDNMSLRYHNVPQEPAVEATVHVKNPHGVITQQAILAVKKALAQNIHTHIVVDGEEDLLVLIVVLYAPENVFVVYGQPYSGIVVIKVTSEKKAQAQEFLNAMKASKS